MPASENLHKFGHWGSRLTVTTAISAEESLHRCSAVSLISANVLAACKKPIGSPADRAPAERAIARWLRCST
jgi:hypothetical protein